MQADPTTGNRALLFRRMLLVETALALGALLFISGAGARTTAQALPSGPRILYASDWTGTMEIFAADATGRAVGQLTFGRPAATCHSPSACGFVRPQPSPDGRRLVYWSTGSFPWEQSTLWLANADGTRARKIGDGLVAAWRPDSRVLAYSAADGVHLLTVGGGNRIVVRSPARELGWSPDGKTLAFTRGEIAAPVALSLYRDGRVSSLLQSGEGDGLLA